MLDDGEVVVNCLASRILFCDRQKISDYRTVPTNRFSNQVQVRQAFPAGNEGGDANQHSFLPVVMPQDSVQDYLE